MGISRGFYTVGIVALPLIHTSITTLAQRCHRWGKFLMQNRDGSNRFVPRESIWSGWAEQYCWWWGWGGPGQPPRRWWQGGQWCQVGCWCGLFRGFNRNGLIRLWIVKYVGLSVNWGLFVENCVLRIVMCLSSLHWLAGHSHWSGWIVCLSLMMIATISDCLASNLGPANPSSTRNNAFAVFAICRWFASNFCSPPLNAFMSGRDGCGFRWSCDILGDQNYIWWFVLSDWTPSNKLFFGKIHVFG